jgi:TatA/E family protein of Tat protein translocase
VLDLSPTKLIIILIVAVVLLGPKRLPEVARQLGATWRKIRAFHARVDEELRQSIPDLPSSGDIARFARSPLSLLDQLADRSPGTISPSGDRSNEGNTASGDVEAAAVVAAAGPRASATGAVTAGASAGGDAPVSAAPEQRSEAGADRGDRLRTDAHGAARPRRDALAPIEDLPASSSRAALFLGGADDPHLN